MLKKLILLNEISEQYVAYQIVDGQEVRAPQPVWINPCKIVTVRESGEGTLIYFSEITGDDDRGPIHVTETGRAVARLIEIAAL